MATTPLYDISKSGLLGERYTALKTTAAKTEQQLLAEVMLGLKEPAYEDQDAELLAMAVALQINYQLEMGVTQEMTKSVVDRNNMTTIYRDRFLSVRAMHIVRSVTKIEFVRFVPLAPGT